MIYNNLVFHNVEEVRQIDGLPGIRLQKVPENIRNKLSEWGQIVVQFAGNSEIRFVPETSKISFTLAAHKDKVRADIWFGEFPSALRFDIDKTPVRIDLDFDGPHYHSPKYLLKLPENMDNSLGFSPRVCRLRFWNEGEGHIHLLEMPTPEKIRLPEKNEVPRRTLLAYGTSITFGFRASGVHLSYPAVCASMLKTDLLNFGMPGSAFCEKELADCLAQRKDWDMAILELSVNMVDSYSVGDFYERVSYMVNVMSASNIHRPVFCITLLPYHDDILGELSREKRFGKPEEYRDALRRAVANCRNENVYLIEGRDLLTDIRGLTSDLIHPGDSGMIEIGNKLSAIISSKLA